MSCFIPVAHEHLSEATQAIKLELVQPRHDKDEYYFASVDDGRYLAVCCGGRGDFSGLFELDSFAFKESVSEATLFRLDQFQLQAWRRHVRIGADVLLRRVGCCYFESWIRARVVDKRRSVYGHQIQVHFDGYTDECSGPRKRSGTTGWIPLESYDIDLEKPNDRRVCTYTAPSDPEAASEAIYEGLGSHLCEQVAREGEDRYGRNVKSRRKRKGKRKQFRSNAEALRSLKRIERKGKKYVKAITHRVYLL